MQYKPLHCWDCGIRVIGGIQGSYVPLANFRNVRFNLSDGSYCESPFCADCADRPWDDTLMKTFQEAVNAVTPLHHIEVVSMGGHRMLTSPIVAILETNQAMQANQS